MFYRFENGLNETDVPQLECEELLLGVCCDDELEIYVKHFHFSMNTLQEYQHQNTTIHKMDSYYGYDFGILKSLEHHSDGCDGKRVALYIRKQLVLVVSEDETLRNYIVDAVDKINAETFSLEHMLAVIIHTLLGNHVKLLEDMENTLADIDEDILNNHMDNFNQQTRIIRNDLRYLSHYFEQLNAVCEELLEDENDFFADNEIHHLRILNDRILRLDSNVHMLKDYLLQIREAWQSQMDMNLNHIMYIFTVVTTIFLPLTLIVGWYGMNFKHMPELTWRYGYIAVIVICALIIVTCLWFFRKKKLLK